MYSKTNDDGYFVENKGQVTDVQGNPCTEIFYTLETDNVRVYFKKNGISYVFRRLAETNSPMKVLANDYKPTAYDTLLINYHRIDLTFDNSTPAVEIAAQEPVSGSLNVYNANFPDGLYAIRHYKKLCYMNMYPNIDIVFYIVDNNNLKYDIIVRPGGNVADIGLKYRGNENIGFNSGNLEVSCPLGTITEFRPYSYLTRPVSAGKFDYSHTDAEVKSSFRIDKNRIGFEIGQYDLSQTLVIDPNVTWSTFYGGSNYDHGYSVAVNRKNELVLVGMTISNDFPVSPGAYQTKIAGSYDMYITLMDQDGTIIWTTLYGGTLNDYMSDVATDNNLGIYVGGFTWSPDFPVSAGAYQTEFGGPENDAVIIKFDSSGIRQWCTLFGGNKTEHLYKIACDSEDNVVATGWTNSNTFTTATFAKGPGTFQDTLDGVEDVFLVKFDSAGHYLWGTYFGGDSTEEAVSMAIDRFDQIFITGSTRSLEFPLTPNAYQNYPRGFRDIFFSQFNSQGQLLYSTLFGGMDNDKGLGICLDNELNIYITGETTSPDLPITQGCLQNVLKGNGDAFITKFDKNKNLIWSTYFGSDGYDFATSIVADRLKNIAITGRTYGNNLLVSPGALSDTLSGGTDAFVNKFRAKDCSLVWGSYYGGQYDEWGRAVTSDEFSNIYSTGSSESPDFPIIDPPIQPMYGGLSDAYLLKLCVSDPNPVVTATGPVQFCAGGKVSLDAGSGYSRYRWSDGSEDRFLDVSEEGDYFVTVWDDNLCKAKSKPLHVTVYPLPEVEIIGDIKICKGQQSALASNNQYISYLWSTGDTTKEITINKPGIYELTVVDSFGCTNSTQKTITYHPVVSSEIQGPTKVCINNPLKDYIISKTNGTLFNWFVVNGEIVSGQNTKTLGVNWHSDADTGYVILVTINELTGCINSDTLKVIIKKSFIPEITTGTQKNFFCEGESLELIAEDGFRDYEWSTGEKTRKIIISKEGTYEVNVFDEGVNVGNNTIDIKMYKKPSPAVFGDTVICTLGKEYVFSTKKNGNNHYKWYSKNGTLTGSQGQYYATFQWNKAGWDSLWVTETVDTSGCFVNSKLFALYVAGEPEAYILYDTPLEFCVEDSVILRIEGDYKDWTWSDGSKKRSITVKTPGEYSVTVSNAYDCQSTENVFVRVNPKPEKPIITQIDDSLFTGSYNWYSWKLNGNPVPGASNMKFVPESEDVYTVEVKNEYGCINESDSYNFQKNVAYSLISIKDKNLRDTVFGGTGRTVKVLLYIENSRNLLKLGANHFTAYLRFNKSLLLPISEFRSLAVTPSEKAISVEGQLIAETGVLKEIEFSSALGNSQCDIIYLDSVVWDVKVNVETKDGVFCLSDYCNTNGDIRLIVLTDDLVFYNVPNPFAGQTEIVYILKEKEYCSVTLSDCYGKQIAVIASGVAGVGENKLTFDTREIASGVYYLTLRTPTKTRVRKVEIVK